MLQRNKDGDVTMLVAKMREPESSELAQKWKSGQISAEDANHICAQMHAHSMFAAVTMAKTLPIKSIFEDVNGILDIGGGSGVYSIALAKHQALRAVIYELPNVAREAEKYIADGKCDQLVRTYSGNMFEEEFPAHDDATFGYNAAFLSNILHDWDEESCEFICRKVYDALPLGGVILIHEALFDNEHKGPLTTALFSFLMFLHTLGKQRSFLEMRDMLTRCGFKKVDILPSSNIFSLVYGKK